MSIVTGAGKALLRAMKLREGGARHHEDYREQILPLMTKMGENRISFDPVVSLGHVRHRDAMPQLVVLEDLADRIVASDKLLATIGRRDLLRTLPSRLKLTKGIWTEGDAHDYVDDVDALPEARAHAKKYRADWGAEQAAKKQAQQAHHGSPVHSPAPSSGGKGKEKL